MDELEQEPEEKYVEGFNNGYLLAKHEPTLASKITANANHENTYFNGLVGGKAQYEHEVKEWSKSFSRGTPDNDTPGKGRDR